jgi:hypothetical protein
MSDVERELGLTREGLVRMAMLLGSDYTEGCQGGEGVSEGRGGLSSCGFPHKTLHLTNLTKQQM